MCEGFLFSKVSKALGAMYDDLTNAFRNSEFRFKNLAGSIKAHWLKLIALSESMVLVGTISKALFAI